MAPNLRRSARYQKGPSGDDCWGEHRDPQIPTGFAGSIPAVSILQPIARLINARSITRQESTTDNR